MSEILFMDNASSKIERLRRLFEEDDRDYAPIFPIQLRPRRKEN